jgi:hypothetical protein
MSQAIMYAIIRRMKVGRRSKAQTTRADQE